MGNSLDSLSEDEVRQITQLVETLDRSTFDYLQVEVGNLKVTIGKGNPPSPIAADAPAASAVPGPASAAASPADSSVARSSTVGVEPRVSKEIDRAENVAHDGTVAIQAPLMGRFYAKPEPGAAPFVSVASEVNADSTVGLIEVMKVFTAVQAGVSGVVTEICVQDAEFIEYGRVLFRVRPKSTAAAHDGAKIPRKGSRR